MENIHKMQSKVESKQLVISLALLSGVTIVVFFPLFTNGFVEWDDYYYITHNDLITSLSWDNIWTWFTKPFRGLYQPLVLVSFALNYAVDGLNPSVFHTTNLALHIVNSILVYFFVSKLTKTHFVALFTAFLFAIHPLHVESVAWATERKDTLYVLFYLWGLLYYQKFIREKSKRSYNLVFVMLVLSLMSKGSAITFPFVLMLIDFVEKRAWYKKSVLLEKVPFFVMAFSYGLMTFYMHYRWGAAQNHTNLETSERILFTAYAFSQYLYKLVIPIRLSAFYPFPHNGSVGFPAFYFIYWLTYLAYFSVLIYSFFKNRIVFFALAFFLSIGLFLMTVGVPIVIADRFTYLPGIGLFMLLSYFINQLFLKIKLENTFVKYLIISPILIYFGLLSYRQAKTWENDFTLWNSTCQNSYINEYIMTKRGSALLEMKKYQEAERDFDEAIHINPEHIKAYLYRGYLYSTLERFQEAESDFLKVIKKEPKNDFAQNSLGYIEYKLGNYEDAIFYIQQVLQKDSLSFDANKNMGYVLLKQDKKDEACVFMQKAIELQGEDVDAEDIAELEKKISISCK